MMMCFIMHLCARLVEVIRPLYTLNETVRRLAPHDQDAIAQAMLNLARSDSEPEPIDPAHLPDVFERLAQARRELATDAQVEAILCRFDPRSFGLRRAAAADIAGIAHYIRQSNPQAAQRYERRSTTA